VTAEAVQVNTTDACSAMLSAVMSLRNCHSPQCCGSSLQPGVRIPGDDLALSSDYRMRCVNGNCVMTLPLTALPERGVVVFTHGSAVTEMTSEIAPSFSNAM